MSDDDPDREQVTHNAKNLTNNKMENFMDSLTLEEKVKLVESANSQPKGKGLKSYTFKEIRCTDVMQRTGNNLTNKVRAEGTDSDKVAAFVDRIENGLYKFVYEQPTVKDLGNGLKELLTGEHRLQAHFAAGRDTIFVAEVEFESEEDEMIFQSNENNEDDEYVKSPRTQNDVILTLSQMVEKGIIDINDDKSINSRLILLQQKSNEFPLLRQRLREKHGKITPVKSYEDKDRRKWCETNKSNIKFSSRTQIVPLDGVVYQSKTFKGGKGKGGLQDLDYDPRCFFDSCEILMKNPSVSKVYNICSVNKSTSEKIPLIRQYKQDLMMKEMLDRVLKIAAAVNNGQIYPVRDVIFNFVPQISGIDNMEELV